MAKPHDGGGGGGGDRLSINQSNSPLAAAAVCIYVLPSRLYILKKVHVVAVVVVLALHLCCGVDCPALRSSMRPHYSIRPDSL